MFCNQSQQKGCSIKKILKSFILICFIYCFTACSSKNAPLQTVEKVELNKYLGTWHEIARYDHFFEKDCKNVTANYSMLDEENIKVINKCIDIQTNKEKEAIGRAYATDKTNSKLKVSFFRPFYGDYWVIILDKEYEYAVIGTPSREYLWILSRNAKLNENIKKRILQKLPILGFEISKLIWTIQEKPSLRIKK